MSEEFERRMRPMTSQAEHAAREELANVRQWYFSCSQEERIKFKQNLQGLITAGEAFNLSKFKVMLHFRWTWCCNEESIALNATLSPKVVLNATDEWDKQDEDDQEWAIE